MSSGETQRKPQLDGLRFILFLMVFAVHYVPDAVRIGYLAYALPVFFVMSGFLITNVLTSADHLDIGAKLKVFYARRILRICPSYFLVLGLITAMGAVAYPGWYAAYLVNIKLFLLSLDPASSEMREWYAGDWRRENWHLWSLSVEEQFYILFPVALYLTPVRHRTTMMVAIVLASITSHVLLMRAAPQSFYGALLPVCMEYFAWGCLFSWWESRRKLTALSPSWTWNLSVLAVVVVVFAQYYRDAPGFLQFVTRLYQTPVALAFGFMIWALWSLPREHKVVRFLSFRPFVYFGEMSYTCYLVHFIALDIFVLTGIELPFPPLINAAIGGFVVTFILAILIWHLFEKPIYDLRRYLPYSKRRSLPVKDAMAEQRG